MKTCKKCNTEKPLGEFHRHRGHKDGLHTYCKPCRSAQDAKWYVANKERKAESDRRWKAENPQRYAYIQQRNAAKKRDIEWGFAQATWEARWGDKFEQRGTGADALCMARRGDKGPYSPDNVVIITNSMNVKHANKRQKLAKLREAK